MVWSRLSVNSTAYIYDTAWGRYVFSKSFPASVFFHSLVDDGYCVVQGVEDKCLEWHSNYSYNATAFIWLELGGALMKPLNTSVLTANDGLFQVYSTGSRGMSVYFLKFSFDFSSKSPGPKLTIEAGRVSGPPTDFQIVVFATFPQEGYVEAGGKAFRTGTEDYIGRVDKVRVRLKGWESDKWKRYFLFDSSDAGFSDTRVGRLEFLGRSFDGIIIRYPLNAGFIDPFLYVVAPGTVTVDWSTTGVKTLLQITDNLSAGRKVVVFSAGYDGAAALTPRGVLQIVKGGNTLVQEGITRITQNAAMRPKHVMLFAYDSVASGSDTYTFTVNVTTTATGTSTLHVQGMVILLDGPAFFTTGSNTNIAAGATVTLATVNTNYPAGSKVAVLAYVEMGVTATTTGHRLYAAGNIRILSSSTVVSQNQFQVGTNQNVQPALVSLVYLDSNSATNPSYSIEVYNSLGEASQAWGEIVAFKVVDGAFLDTGSVALTSGSQVTVGSLSTSLSGEVGVIGLASSERTATSDTATAFNAGGVVLQINNDASTQVANQRVWAIQRTSYSGRSGTYALFRADDGVSNPSYQIKMTAAAASQNGEAKILAFVVSAVQTYVRNIAETVVIYDSVSRTAVMERLMSDMLLASDLLNVFKFKLVSLTETLLISDTIVRTATLTRLISDTLTIAESLTRQATLYRVIAENVLISSPIEKVLTIIRAIAEGVQMSDSVTRASALIRSVVEDVLISGPVTRTQTLTRTIAENISVSSPITRTLTIVKIIAENILATDSNVRIPTFTRVIMENVAMTDPITRISAFIRAVSEDAVITDVTTRTLQLIRILEEIVSSFWDISVYRPGLIVQLLENLTIPSDISSEHIHVGAGTATTTEEGSAPPILPFPPLPFDPLKRRSDVPPLLFVTMLMSIITSLVIVGIVAKRWLEEEEKKKSTSPADAKR
ncbi:MAG: hypothetical protein QW580_01930 [Nitrososphaerota archaeon]